MVNQTLIVTQTEFDLIQGRRLKLRCASAMRSVPHANHLLCLNCVVIIREVEPLSERLFSAGFWGIPNIKIKDIDSSRLNRLRFFFFANLNRYQIYQWRSASLADKGTILYRLRCCRLFSSHRNESNQHRWNLRKALRKIYESKSFT